MQLREPLPLAALRGLDEGEKLREVQSTLRVEVSRRVADFDGPVPAVVHERAGDVLLEGPLVRFHAAASGIFELSCHSRGYERLAVLG